MSVERGWAELCAMNEALVRERDTLRAALERIANTEDPLLGIGSECEFAAKTLAAVSPEGEAPDYPTPMEPYKCPTCGTSRMHPVSPEGEAVLPDGTVVDALGNFVGIDQPAASVSPEGEA